MPKQIQSRRTKELVINIEKFEGGKTVIPPPAPWWPKRLLRNNTPNTAARNGDHPGNSKQ